MPIINYTTKISASKTVGEISEILSVHGASKIVVDYEKGTPVLVSFHIATEKGLIYFSLPARYKGVYKVMAADKKIPRSFVTEEQSIRVSWRIIKDWVEAQMAIVESGMAEIGEVFFPYAITNNGNTIYEEIKQQNHKNLLKQP